MFSKVVSRRAKTQFTLVFAFFIHYLTRRLRFNGHFISLIPTKHYYYLAYKHRDSLDEHRLFKFIEFKELYKEDGIYNALLEIRKVYGHDHENNEYDEDYKEVIDYLLNSRDNTI